MQRRTAVLVQFLLGAFMLAPSLAHALDDASHPTEVAQLEFADPALTHCVQRWAAEGFNQYKKISEVKDLMCAHAGIRNLNGMQQLTDLGVVDLSNNPIEDYAPLTLLPGSLRFVWLFGNVLTCESMISLQKSLPKALIGGLNQEECKR